MAKNVERAQECKLINNCQNPAWCSVMRTWCTASVKQSGRRSSGTRA